MQALDHRIVAWLSGLDLPLVTPLMKLASAVGADGSVFVGIAIWVALTRRRIAAVPWPCWLAVLASSSCCRTLMKEVVDRARPSVTYADVHPLVAVPDRRLDAERPCLDRVRRRHGAVRWRSRPAAAGSWAWPPDRAVPRVPGGALPQRRPGGRRRGSRNRAAGAARSSTRSCADRPRRRRRSPPVARRRGPRRPRRRSEAVPPNDVRSALPGFEKNLITHTSNAEPRRAPAPPSTPGNGRVDVVGEQVDRPHHQDHQSKQGHQLRAAAGVPSAAARAPADGPPGSVTLAVAVYQLKNTLISRTSAPPAEIQTDRGTAAKSKLAAGGDDCGGAAVDSAAGGGGGGGAGSGSGSGVGSAAGGGGTGVAEDSVGTGSGLGSGPASSPAVGSFPSVLMGPPLTTACGCSRPSTTQNLRAREIPVEVPPGDG